ncbi:MAG: putative manganese transporter, partial [Candidatus Puniceispirillum sp.]
MPHPPSPPAARFSAGRAALWHGLMILLPVVLAAVTMTYASSALLDIIFRAIADAYIQVSTFVAGTFFLFYGVERWLKIDATKALRDAGNWQVPVAAALGALPGCGGAIIVVTQYVTGRLSFGSVVAVLTATMGDAAFLLLAQEPLTGLGIILLGFGVGTISGWLVNALHGQDFLRGSTDTAEAVAHLNHDASTPWLDRIWLLIMLPGLVLAGLVAFQVDADALFANAYISMRLAPRFGISGDKVFSLSGSILRRTVADTNFVTAWVIGAYLMFDLSIYFFALDLKTLFSGYTIFTPLAAILIGFLPGCGPQVLVT